MSFLVIYLYELAPSYLDEVEARYNLGQVTWMKWSPVVEASYLHEQASSYLNEMEPSYLHELAPSYLYEVKAGYLYELAPSYLDEVELTCILAVLCWLV